MASRALARFMPRPIIIRAPRARRAARRVYAVARRGARRVGRAARAALPTTTTALGAAGVGYLVGSGRLDFLPEIGGSKMVALAGAGWLATRMSSNKYVRAAGFAALMAGAFDWGRSQGAGGTHGDDSWGWDT
jgi:hypothetical protein